MTAPGKLRSRPGDGQGCLRGSGLELACRSRVCPSHPADISSVIPGSKAFAVRFRISLSWLVFSMPDYSFETFLLHSPLRPVSSSPAVQSMSAGRPARPASRIGRNLNLLRQRAPECRRPLNSSYISTSHTTDLDGLLCSSAPPSPRL